MGLRGPKPGTLGERPRVGGRFVPVARTESRPVSTATKNPRARETAAHSPAPAQSPETGKSFPVAAVVHALEQSYGLLNAAAALLGCHRDTIANYADQFDAVKAALLGQRERLKDIAELALVRKINDGDLGAICFFLKTQAKDRGYIERYEQDTRLLGNLVINVKYEESPQGGIPVADGHS